MGTVYIVEAGKHVKTVLSGTGNFANFSIPFPFPVQELYLTRAARYTLAEGITWNITSLIAGDGTLVNNGALRILGSSLYVSAQVNNNGAFFFGGNTLTIGERGYLSLPQSPRSGR